jgi:hypothetical protein
MANEPVFSGDIDPEIADLLGQSARPREQPKRPQSTQPAPGFDDLFGTGEPVQKQAFKSDVDLSRKTFPTISKLLEDKPNAIFSDPEYYKKCVAGEGDVSNQFHNILTKFLQTKDPKDKGVYRQNMIPVFWNLLERVANKAASPSLISSKQMLLRFSVMAPNLLSPEQKDMISRIPVKNELGEPVHYVDEWLRSVATGAITPSSTDEVKVSRNDEQGRFQNLISKAQGKRDAAEGLLKARAAERRSLEVGLREKATSFSRDEQDGPVQPYTEFQKKTMNDIGEIMREMLRVDKDLVRSHGEFEQAEDDLRKLQEKVEGMGITTTVNTQALSTEFETVRQMAKMCIGRQGNHFPLLVKEYLHGGIQDFGSRENVIQILAWIESIDSEAYCRSHKNVMNRIVPYVVLAPCYGDFGVCWEPFDRFNRATSRGRICIPMYPKNLKMAIIYAVADLRWQVAKEKASYYWMEEGLTGNYYQWFQSRKLKGDVKVYFIADYINWLLKESEGTQKLDKEVRQIFWRYLPFSQPVKEKLKTRSLIYQELYQRDVNRSLSDGY